jgi:hypothetical protein
LGVVQLFIDRAEIENLGVDVSLLDTSIDKVLNLADDGGTSFLVTLDKILGLELFPGDLGCALLDGLLVPVFRLEPVSELGIPDGKVMETLDEPLRLIIGNHLHIHLVVLVVLGTIDEDIVPVRLDDEVIVTLIGGGLTVLHMVGDTDLVRTDHIVHRRGGRVIVDATVSLLTEHHIVDEFIHILQDFGKLGGGHGNLVIIDILIHGHSILEIPAGTLPRILISPGEYTVSDPLACLCRTTRATHMVLRDERLIGMILFPRLLALCKLILFILFKSAGERGETEHLSDLLLSFLTNHVQSLLGLFIRKVGTILVLEPPVLAVCLRLIGIIPGQAAVVVGCAILESILDIVTLVILLENNNGVNHRASEHVLLILKVFLDKV